MAYGRKRFTERDVFRQHSGSKREAEKYKHQSCQKYEFSYGFKKNESVEIIEVSYIPLPTGLQRKKRYLAAILKRFPSCCSTHFERGR